MKFNTHKTWAIMVAICLFSSCEKVIDFNTEETEPQVVVMSIPKAGKPVDLRLTYSRFFLDDHDFKTIDNATVVLNVNGTDHNVSSHSLGNYFFDYTPSAGDTLTLRTSVPGHNDVIAATRIPKPAIISGATLTKGAQQDGYTTYNASIILNDDPSQHNYYQLRLFRTYTDDSGSVHKQKVYMGSSDPVLFDPDVFAMMDEDSWDDQFFFTDDQFNGKNYTIQFNFELYNNTTEGCLIEVTTLSRDLYLYKKTVNQSEDDFLAGIMSEPVQIHTNITGGLGIFAASNCITYEVTMPSNTKKSKHKKY